MAVRFLLHFIMVIILPGQFLHIHRNTNHPKIEVIAIGEKNSKKSKITVGLEAISRLRQLKADLCFLGINAINIENGVSDNDWEVVQIKKAMIESAQKIICLTIAEKLNSIQPIQVCKTTDIDILITELSPADPQLAPYVEAGITVL